ncbi:hypothetical protein [Tateyamaria sp. SN6-1]|uniref:hypothetical protein n=1 Tax=Tateyamaria sp. SN6-1 TaxID=3092148 RepID=UPI0039F454CF
MKNAGSYIILGTAVVYLLTALLGMVLAHVSLVEALVQSLVLLPFAAIGATAFVVLAGAYVVFMIDCLLTIVGGIGYVLLLLVGKRASGRALFEKMTGLEAALAQKIGKAPPEIASPPAGPKT